MAAVSYDIRPGGWSLWHARFASKFECVASARRTIPNKHTDWCLHDPLPRRMEGSSPQAVCRECARGGRGRTHPSLSVGGAALLRWGQEQEEED